MPSLLWPDSFKPLLSTRIALEMHFKRLPAQIGFIHFLQALKILDDEMQCDIIKIGNLIRNKVSDSALMCMASC